MFTIMSKDKTLNSNAFKVMETFAKIPDLDRKL